MSLRAVKTDSPEVQALWDATADEVDRLDGESIGARGRVVSWTFAGAGSGLIPHGLGRLPVGWIPVDLSAAVTLYRSAWTAQHITLVASGAATVSVLVF